MSTDRWPRVKEVFQAALERPVGERRRYAEAACEGDAALLEEVLALLGSHRETDAFLARPVVAAGEVWDDEVRTRHLTAAPTGALPPDGASPDPLAGSELDGKYRIEALLGRGGMGAVYRATDLDLGRTVAIKVLREELGAGGALAERFRREALTVAKLRHRHIVSVYDFGTAPEVGAYLVMEYLEGCSLAEEIKRRGCLPIALAVEVMRQVCSAVDAAHRAWVVHRDLKPANVFLERAGDGFVAKVLDFGIAKPESGGERLTASGAVLGTPAYMAPEQCLSKAVDARTDVYALGCMLYEMLAGRPPFEGASMGELIVKHVTEPPPPISRTDVPSDLEAAVLRALAKAPEERFQTAGELAAALNYPRSAGIAEDTADGRCAGVTSDTESGQQQTAKGGRRTLVNLSHAMTRFVGRERQIEEVRARLSTARLVTLTGPGGIGKTRLALEVAADAAARFDDGVRLVELAALADGALVPQAVAKALGAREEPGRSVEETLAKRIATKRLLLVMDNCEHLVETCAGLVNTLLHRCANLHVLATSREALGVVGEAIWSVPPLSVPLRADAAAAEHLAEYDATALFLDRARMSEADFAAGAHNAHTIAEVCRRLDGMPLAIELAAARVKVLPVEQILERLDDRFRLLTGGSRTAPTRQQTLRAALDWSYELLTKEERVLLLRLSVFAGGRTLEAAEAICRGEGREMRDESDDSEITPRPSLLAPGILDLLTRLVDKSLVAVEERGGEARYGMLETVREYAVERLEASGEADEVRRRHAEYFLALAEAAEPELVGARQAEWLDRLEAEHDNLRAALGWTLEYDPDACLRLSTAVRYFWTTHGHLSEGRQWLEAALARTTTAASRVREKALSGAENLAMRQGDLPAARAYSEEKLRISKETGNALAIAWSSCSLGEMALRQGDLKAARIHFDESLAAGQELGHARLVGQSFNDLGEVARLEGDWGAARPLYEQALTAYRKAGYPHGVSVALLNLGAVAWEDGDPRTARACYREALLINQEIGSKDGVAGSLDGLAAVAAYETRWKRAARLAGAAQVLYEAVAYELELIEIAFRERFLAGVREQLGEAGLEACSAEGRAMTLERAIGYALGGDDER